jgi:hypothetical protein
MRNYMTDGADWRYMTASEKTRALLRDMYERCAAIPYGPAPAIRGLDAFAARLLRYEAAPRG